MANNFLIKKCFKTLISACLSIWSYYANSNQFYTLGDKPKISQPAQVLKHCKYFPGTFPSETLQDSIKVVFAPFYCIKSDKHSFT